jgi:hypothetical protein
LALAASTEFDTLPKSYSICFREMLTDWLLASLPFPLL